MNNLYNRSVVFTPNQSQPQTNLTPTLRPISNANIPVSYQKSTYIPVNKVRFDADYLFGSLKDGLIRGILIICLLAGMISILTVPANNATFQSYTDLSSTQIAYLIFILIALIISLLIFFLSIFSIINFTVFRFASWLAILILILDAIFLVLIFCVSVAAAVRESQLPQFGPLIYSVVNRGAFVAAAVFGFLSVIFLAVLVVFDVLKLSWDRFLIIDTASGNKSSPPKAVPMQYF